MQISNGSTEAYKNLNGIIKIDQAHIRSHLDTVVRGTVEETLNKMLQPRRTSFVRLPAMNTASSGPRPGPAIIGVSCTPRPVK